METVPKGEDTIQTEEYEASQTEHSADFESCQSFCSEMVPPPDSQLHVAMFTD